MKLLISNDNLSSLKFFANLGKLIEYSLMFVKKMYICLHKPLINLNNMKKPIILPFILIVLTLGLTACDKQQKSTKVVKEETDSVNKVKSEKLIENKDSAQPETSNRAEEENFDVQMPPSMTFDEADFKNYDGGGIAEIRKRWRYEDFQLYRGDETNPGIEQFAYAFCLQFNEFPPVNAMHRYLTGPENSDKNYFKVDCQSKNGYIRCDAATQYDFYTESCYWKRNNGHVLLGVFMAEEYENPSKNDQLTLFYDYDPATYTLTPEPAISDMIEKRMNEFDKYRALLPAKGKDIKINAYMCDYEYDSADITEYTLKWDGQSFKWVK